MVDHHASYIFIETPDSPLPRKHQEASIYDVITAKMGFAWATEVGRQAKKIKDLYLTEIWTRSFSRNDEDNCRYYLVDHGTAWPTHLFLADGVYNYGAKTSICRCGLSVILVSTTHRQSHALTCYASLPCGKMQNFSGTFQYVANTLWTWLCHSCRRFNRD